MPVYIILDEDAMDELVRGNPNGVLALGTNDVELFNRPKGAAAKVYPTIDEAIKHIEDRRNKIYTVDADWELDTNFEFAGMYRLLRKTRNIIGKVETL